MANSRDSALNREYATVDTDPESTWGYFTNPVNPRDKSVKEIFFSIRETDLDDSSGAPASVVVVTLQFKCPGDADWQDYYNDGVDYEIGQREKIEDHGAGVLWRAGVKWDGYTSGSVTFGFDW
jgi:hypothetical protein